ncbi:MAG: T9SS type A sorting domain-containing protein [Candidatus Stygibacter frigidus]|nr:T9SS type A sorting domain-containing protein [Candidatus Stygibacter frigidus]
MEIYNIKGQKIDTVLEQQMSAGAHSVIWNAEGQNSGIYFLRFEAGDQCDVKKVILLK